ncbi:MAG: hypothetical protein EOP62_02490 [Sphingomonadales bacterium]|nr:MAG: hypothetical protein EOP62_02490 [Sphingomonadales bacterium]
MNPYDWFDKGLQKGGSAPLLIAPGGLTLTYGDMEVAATGLAATIHAEQGEGARVAVLSRNYPWAFVGILAAWRSAGAWVPLTYRNTVEENVDLLNELGVEWLLYHSDFDADVEVIRTRVGGLRRAICIDREGREDSLHALVEAAKNLPLPTITDDRDRIIAFGASGGSTGRPKSIEISSLAWETMAATASMIMPFSGRPKHLLVAPMAHAAGVLAALLLSQGASNILLDQFDPTEVLDAIEAHGITHLFLPPTALYGLLEEARVRNRDYSSLQYLIISAGPASPHKLKEAVDVLGPCLCQAYGQAEAPFFMTWLSPGDIVDAVNEPDKSPHLRSCGKETELVRLAVVDPAGTDFLPTGEVGEIAVRSNLCMTGYYNQPEATQALRDIRGWQRTGDVGYVDEDGYYYITDRKRDMIISGGYNIYCTEVEQAILAHPDVENAAVFGIPHDRWGEAVTAAVQLKPSRGLSEEELIAFCREELGSLRAPKTISFHEQLPRNAAGKVLKRDLRAPYWVGVDRQVS